MKTQILSIAFLFFSCFYSSAQKYQWANQFGVLDAETNVSDASIDTNENVYLTGKYSGEMTIGGTELPKVSAQMDAFVSKFSKDNNSLFALSINSTTGTVNSTSIASDTDGNVYVVGDFEMEASVGTSMKIESEYSDMFVAKINSDGTPLWLKRLGNASGGQNVKKIQVDAEGNFIIAGKFDSSFNPDLDGRGSVRLEAKNNTTMSFLIKYNKKGELVWAKATEGTGTSCIDGMALDELGNIYAIGNFIGAISFNEGRYLIESKNSENTDNFLVKYDAAGNFVWGKSLLGSKADNFADIDVKKGQVVLGGFIRSKDLEIGKTADVIIESISNSTLPTHDYSILVISFDVNGIYKWNYVGGSLDNPAAARSVKIENDGSVWSGGIAFGGFYFNPTGDDEHKFHSPALGSQDMYLLKLSSRGKVLMGYRIGAKTTEEAAEILLGKNGLMFVVDLVAKHKGTETPVSLYEEPKQGITPINTGKKINVALLCYKQIYAVPLNLEKIVVNKDFNLDIIAHNSNGDVTFTLEDGVLPGGITLSNSGKLSGNPTSSGTYNFVISMKDTEGNIGFIDYVLVVGNSTSVETAEKSNISISVGLDGSIRVKTNEDNSLVFIYDTMGKKIVETIANRSYTQFMNLKGVYIVKVATSTGIFTEKVTVQ